MDATIPDRMGGEFRMLAGRSRPAILRGLIHVEPNVTRAVKETGRGQANMSKRLKMLAEAGQVGRRKEGLQVSYRTDDRLSARKGTHLARNGAERERRGGPERGRSSFSPRHGTQRPAPPRILTQGATRCGARLT